MGRPSQLIITSPQAWRVLLSPIRTEIVEALRCGGAMSMAELSTATGRANDSLYRHVELLRGAGFIVQAGFRKRGRHIEQLIDAAADDFRLELGNDRGDEENLVVIDTVRTFAKAAERTVRDAARAREFRFEQSARNLSINYELGWLTPAAFEEVRSLIRRLKAVMDEGRRKREGRLYMSFVVATPVVRKATRRPSKDKPSKGKPPQLHSARNKTPRGRPPSERPPSELVPSERPPSPRTKVRGSE